MAARVPLPARVVPRLTVQLERLEPPGTRHAEEGRIAAQKLLRRGKPFTALVAFNVHFSAGRHDTGSWLQSA
jgi:hypothetical protein